MEAEAYLIGLENRVKRFGLELAPEKTRCMEFGRFARKEARKRGEKPKEFTFLGFTHYCGKTKRGYFKVKRRTDRKKRVIGHLNYYAISDNADQCDRFVYYATRLLFKWLNRKSQRRAYTWEGYNHALEAIGWPKPRIHIDLDPCRRAEAY
jgi:hypothetical protein